MTAEQFTYWLQGFLETANPSFIDEKQTQIIKDHLALVFNKVTPDYHKLFLESLNKKIEIKPSYEIKEFPVNPYPGTGNNPYRVIC